MTACQWAGMPVAAERPDFALVPRSSSPRSWRTRLMKWTNAQSAPMVGLVIVSHSARLAEGVLELARQMTQGSAPLAIAGGIDDPENPIGTDAMKVIEAIDAVYSPDGVVVLMDLGSALLSAETALEFLPDDRRDRVFLSKAPLVEGAMAAAVQAMVGAPIEQVLAEAET